VRLLERDAQLVTSLCESRDRLGAQAVQVERADALRWMAAAAPGQFDLVLLDPPFDAGLALRAGHAVGCAGGRWRVRLCRVRRAAGRAVPGLDPWRQGRARRRQLPVVQARLHCRGAASWRPPS
jgi:16S rRNA (guanine966-N2)-methyltransferase